MTVHAFTVGEMGHPASPAGLCSCGQWREYFPSETRLLDPMDHLLASHRLHVQHAADWDALEKAVLWCVLDGVKDDAHAALTRLRKQLR